MTRAALIIALSLAIGGGGLPLLLQILATIATTTSKPAKIDNHLEQPLLSSEQSC